MIRKADSWGCVGWQQDFLRPEFCIGLEFLGVPACAFKEAKVLGVEFADERHVFVKAEVINAKPLPTHGADKRFEIYFSDLQCSIGTTC